MATRSTPGLFIPIEAERLAIKKLEAVREAVGDDGELHAWFQDVCFGDFPRQKDGFLPLPEGPGLGVEVDEDWVKPNPWRDDAAVWRAGTGYIASRQDTNGS